MIFQKVLKSHRPWRWKEKSLFRKTGKISGNQAHGSVLVQSRENVFVIMYSLVLITKTAKRCRFFTFKRIDYREKFGGGSGTVTRSFFQKEKARGTQVMRGIKTMAFFRWENSVGL